MILSLRQRHRRMFAVISVLLPLAFIFGIVAHKPVPSAAGLPAGLAAPMPQSAASVWERGDLFAKAPVPVRLLRGGTDRFAIALSSAGDFVKPDLIVYWVVGSPNVTDTLPENALLLGSFGSTALPLPDEASKAHGALVLYSLADNEVVDVSKPFTAKQD